MQQACDGALKRVDVLQAQLDTQAAARVQQLETALARMADQEKEAAQKIAALESVHPPLRVWYLPMSRPLPLYGRLGWAFFEFWNCCHPR